MNDSSVPAHWRLLGILNGFFINGKKVYASNEWFAEQLKCSTRTVTDAISKLEQLGKIHCERTRTSRVITDVKDSNQLLPPSQPTAIPDSNQLLSNADHNADRKDLVAGATEIVSGSFQPFVVVVDRPPAKPKNKNHEEIKKVFRLFGRDCYERIGIRKQEYEAAKYLLEKYGMEKLKNAMEYVKENADTDHFYTVDSPYELRIKWGKLSRHKLRNGN